MEENAIVNSLEFEESGDRAHVIGQFISADGSKPMQSGGRMMNRYSSSGDSAEITLLHAKRAIQLVASSMRLKSSFVDQALGLYRLALQRRLLYGRQQTHVVATCLYIICRIEKSPHLLLDFSDSLQVNVYLLGKTFLQFIRLLNLQERLKIVDPVLFIPRFAARFDLGNALTNVIDTAQRIVARMKRDWIVIGRHPDGICAAAMFIASRCHGVEKSPGEVAKIFRVSLATLKQRLVEFQTSPASQLTVRQFNDNNLVIEDIMEELGMNVSSNPPSFIRNNRKAQAQAEQQNGVQIQEIIDEDGFECEENGNEDFDVDRSQGQSESSDNNIDEVKPGRKQQTSISIRKETKNQALANLYENIYDSVREASTSRDQEPQLNMQRDVADKDGARGRIQEKVSTVVILPKHVNIRALLQDGAKIYPKENTDNSTAGSVVSVVDEDENEGTIATVDSGRDDVSGIINSAEMDGYLLNNEEQEKRTAIFEKNYRGFLDNRNIRRIEREKSTSGGNRKRKVSGRSGSGSAAAAGSVPSQDDGQRKSSKINYDALKTSHARDGRSSRDNRQPVIPPPSSSASISSSTSAQQAKSIPIPGIIRPPTSVLTTSSSTKIQIPTSSQEVVASTSALRDIDENEYVSENEEEEFLHEEQDGYDDYYGDEYD